MGNKSKIRTTERISIEGRQYAVPKGCGESIKKLMDKYNSLVGNFNTLLDDYKDMSENYNWFVMKLIDLYPEEAKEALQQGVDPHQFAVEKIEKHGKVKLFGADGERL